MDEDEFHNTFTVFGGKLELIDDDPTQVLLVYLDRFKHRLWDFVDICAIPLGGKYGDA